MDINAKRKEGEKDSTIAITITESIPNIMVDVCLSLRGRLLSSRRLGHMGLRDDPSRIELLVFEEKIVSELLSEVFEVVKREAAKEFQANIKPGSVWKYDRGLDHASNTRHLKILKIREGLSGPVAEFDKPMPYGAYGLEYFGIGPGFHFTPDEE